MKRWLAARRWAPIAAVAAAMSCCSGPPGSGCGNPNAPAKETTVDSKAAANSKADPNWTSKSPNGDNPGYSTNYVKSAPSAGAGARRSDCLTVGAPAAGFSVQAARCPPGVLGVGDPPR